MIGRQRVAMRVTEHLAVVASDLAQAITIAGRKLHEIVGVDAALIRFAIPYS